MDSTAFSHRVCWDTIDCNVPSLDFLQLEVFCLQSRISNKVYSDPRFVFFHSVKVPLKVISILSKGSGSKQCANNIFDSILRIDVNKYVITCNSICYYLWYATKISRFKHCFARKGKKENLYVCWLSKGMQNTQLHFFVFVMHFSCVEKIMRLPQVRWSFCLNIFHPFKLKKLHT